MSVEDDDGNDHDENDGVRAVGLLEGFDGMMAGGGGDVFLSI